MTKAVDIANDALAAVGEFREFPSIPMLIGTDKGVVNADDLERKMYQQDRLVPYGRSPASEALARIDILNRTIHPLWIGHDEAGGIDQAIISSLVLPRRDTFSNLSTVTTAREEPAQTLNVEMIMTAREVLERNSILTQHFEDYRNEVINSFMHRGQILRDFISNEPEKKRPDTAPTFEMMSKYPKIIHGPAGMVARLLDDEHKTYDESDEMRHCLWRYYTPKIRAGEFIAYHIDTPTLFKHGFTCCYSKADAASPWTDPVRDVAIIQTVQWQIDQIRGKANSTSNDRDLQQFSDNILMLINEVENDKG